MAFNISRTDQVLVLLNRLANSEDPSKPDRTEREFLLDQDHCGDGNEVCDSHLGLDVEGQSSRRWSGTAKGPTTRRKSQDTEPAAALRIVLGDRKSSSAGERKLRYDAASLAERAPSSGFVKSHVDIAARLQVYRQLQNEALWAGKAQPRFVCFYHLSTTVLALCM